MRGSFLRRRGGVRRAAVFLLGLQAVVAGADEAPFPLLEGFESGQLDSYWSSYSSPGGRIRVTPADQPLYGSYHLVMDSTNSYALNEAVLTVDLSGHTNVQFDAWIKDFNDDPEYLPTQFSGHANADGIAVSPDGTNWWSLVTPFFYEPDYRRVTTNLSAFAAAKGFSTGPGFRIKFQQYDNYPTATDGRSFDHIQLYDPANATDLSLALTESSDPAVVSQPLTLTLTVTNRGLLAAADVAVDHRCPTGVPIVSVSASQGSWTRSNEWVYAELGAVAPGAAAVVEIVLQPDHPGTITNQAWMTASTFDPNPADNAAQAQTLVDYEGGDLRFASAAAAADEDWEPVPLTVYRTNHFAGLLTVHYETRNGSATGGADYAVTQGTLTFTNGQREASLAIPLTDDAAAEGTEQFEVALDNPTGGAVLAGPTNTLITIRDQDGVAGLPFSETFESGSFSNAWTRYLTEGGGVLINTNGQAHSGLLHAVLQSADWMSSLNELVLALDLSGRQGVRLRFWHKRLTYEWDDPLPAVFNGHASYADGVSISPNGLTWYRALDLDGADTGTNVYRLFEVELDPILAAHGLGYTSRFLIKFQQSDYYPHPYAGRMFDDIEVWAPNGDLRIEHGTYEAAEGAGAITVAVVRVGGQAGTVTANYATSNDTAAAGSDYAAVTGVLTFADGVLRQEVIIPLLDDGAVEPFESFTFSLSDPTGGAALLDPYVATVGIGDDDGPGALSFSDASYWEFENGGFAVITVLRRYGTNGTIRVSYRTEALTASPGTDYTDVSGTLTFEPGAPARAFEVPLLDDALQEPNETVRVLLENPQDGAGLGLQSNAVLTLVDDERPRAAFPFQEPFENTTLSNCWELASTAGGRVQAVTNTGSFEGLRHLAMDSSSAGVPALNEAILTVDLSGQTDVVFRCWVKDFLDPVNPMPDTFTGSAAADGIAVSPDGVHWQKLADLPGPSAAAVYTQIVADLDGFAAAHGLPLTAAFQIKLQQYGDNVLGTRGRCFDHLSLTPGVPTGPTVIRAQGFEGLPGDTWDFHIHPGAGTIGLRTDRKRTGLRSLKLSGSYYENADPYVEFDNVSIADYRHVQLSVAFSATGPDTDDDLHLDLSYDNGATWNGAGSVKLVDGYSNAEIPFGGTNPSNPTTVSNNPWTVSIPEGQSQVKVRLRFNEKSNSNASIDHYYLDDLVLSYLPTQQPPRLVDLPDRVALVSNRLEFVVRADDIDGDLISLYAGTLPPGSDFPETSASGSVSQVFSFTPEASQDGAAYTVDFHAEDKDGADAAGVQITVLDKRVEFETPRATFREEGGPVSVNVSISRAADATVNLLASGTAVAGTDYALSPTTLTFAVGAPTVQAVLLTPLQDEAAEGPETAQVLLSPGPGVRLGQDTLDLFLRDDDSFTLVSANLTSGGNQKYNGPGAAILQGLKPDVVAIQEFNVTNAGGHRAFVDLNFGPEFDYFVEPSGSLPNGVISRWPIVAAGEWDDPQLTDRDFVWATIAVPGGRRLHVVSVHLHASGGSSSREIESQWLTNYLRQADFHPGDYVAVAGDLNTQTRFEAALQILETALENDRVPADQNADTDTNQNRDKPYDYVLPADRLNGRHLAATMANQVFAEGLVFDTRLWSPPDLPYPVEVYDSSALAMQHMAVLKTFALDRFATILARAGPEGTVQPGSPEVGLGSNQAFQIEAAAYYHIAAVKTNGAAASIPADPGSLNWTWSNVVQNGVLDVVFAENRTIYDVPEWWLAKHGLTDEGWETEALSDQDHDGLVTWREFHADTDPTNEQSVFTIARLDSGGSRLLSFVSSTARIYSVDFTGSAGLPAAWSSLAAGLRGSNLVTTVTDTNTAPFRLYRVTVALPD